MSGKIKYVVGDATQPIGDGVKIIAHVCNDIGKWGKGFVIAISNRWRKPEYEFKKWYAERETNDFALGAVQLVSVDESLYVANMIGQHTVCEKDGLPPIRYEALETCLSAVSGHALRLGASVHMPRIGCGLAGGEWTKVSPIIEHLLTAQNVSVTVYDFDGAS